MKTEQETNGTLVFQSDFGTIDGAVSAMYGVAEAVSGEIKLYDLTHEIPQFNIWEASYRLIQTIEYWRPGTVFVSVVDPGVGTDRKSVVALTGSGHYIVTPDNGTLTHIAETIGIRAMREIEESSGRLRGSEKSYTFHGRDVYAFTGARLASAAISFTRVGPELTPEPVLIDHRPARLENGVITAGIDILDARYGSLWTDIPREMFESLGVGFGETVLVEISKYGNVVYGNRLIYGKSFSDAAVGQSLVYINSLLNVGIAINQGNFSRAHNIESGRGWVVRLSRGA
jgi:S-adenosylmethionine hydrolase